MNRTILIRLAVCAIALAVFAWLYIQTKTKPITVNNPPVVMVPPDPARPPQKEIFTPQEKEYYEKLRKEHNETIERLKREGRPVVVTPPKGDDGLPQQPPN